MIVAIRPPEIFEEVGDYFIVSGVDPDFQFSGVAPAWKEIVVAFDHAAGHIGCAGFQPGKRQGQAVAPERVLRGVADHEIEDAWPANASAKDFGIFFIKDDLGA